MVEAGSSVYVVANIPAEEYTALTTKTGLTLNDIQNCAPAMVVLNDDSGASWKTVTLSNHTGGAVAISEIVDDQTSVDVQISPAVARLELVSVRAKNDFLVNEKTARITTFKVTGVWVDDFYPYYTLNGKGYGKNNESTLVNERLTFENDATKLEGWVTDYKMGDLGTWSSTGTAFQFANPDKAETADVAELWGYNVAATAAPRLVLRIDDVKYLVSGEETEETYVLNGKTELYLTVRSYSIGTGTDSQPLTSFQRGHVYRIGTSTNYLTFELENLSEEPNEGNLTANVEVLAWTIDLPTAQL
jgi:hypothetical protein